MACSVLLTLLSMEPRQTGAIVASFCICASPSIFARALVTLIQVYLTFSAFEPGIRTVAMKFVVVDTTDAFVETFSIHTCTKTELHFHFCLKETLLHTVCGGGGFNPHF